MTVALAAAPIHSTEKPTPPIRRMAIVVRDDAFDRLLTPLAFAYEMGKRDVEVDVLCVLWAVRVLSKDGVKQVKIDPRYADRRDYLLGRLAHFGEPQDIHGFIKAAHSTGHVRFHACQIAAATFEVSPEDLLPEVTDIMHPTAFLSEIAARADHCQYF